MFKGKGLILVRINLRSSKAFWKISTTQPFLYGCCLHVLPNRPNSTAAKTIENNYAIRFW